MGFKEVRLHARSFLVISVFLATGCGLYQQAMEKDLVNGSDVSGLLTPPCSQSALEAFRNTVYPQVRTKCAACHGANQMPLFAMADVQVAYSEAKNRTNFQSPNQSRLYIKAQDGHCGANCQNGGTILTAIQQWAAVENNPTACPSVVPSVIPSITPSPIVSVTPVPTPTSTTPALIASGTLLESNGLKATLSASQTLGACVAYTASYVEDRGSGNVSTHPMVDKSIVLSGSSFYSSNTCSSASLITAAPIYGSSGNMPNSTQKSVTFYIKPSSAGSFTVTGLIMGESLRFTIMLTVNGVAPSPLPSSSPSASPTPSPSPSPTQVAAPCSAAQKQTAFQHTVYTLTVNKCVACHNGGQSPNLSSSNVATAYSGAKSKVANFLTPLSSRLYIKSKDGHCGSSTLCGSGNQAQMQTFMQQWSAVETATNCSLVTIP